MWYGIFLGGFIGSAAGFIAGLWGGFFITEREYARDEAVEANPYQLELDLSYARATYMGEGR